MKLAAKIACLLLLISTVLSCGDQKDTQVNPVADNAIVKDSSKASDSAEAQLVAGQQPLSAFSYSKEKITAEEKKFFSKFDKDARDDSPHLKIDLDPKAIFELLRKGGVLRVALKGERVLDFEFKAGEVDAMGAVSGYSRIVENTEGDYSDLSVTALEAGLAMTIRTLRQHYEVEGSAQPKAYFLIHTDPRKQASHHGTGPNAGKGIMGGPPIPLPLKPEKLDFDLPKGPSSVPGTNVEPRKKSVTSGVNIRIGVLVAKQAALETVSNPVGFIADYLEGITWLTSAMNASSTGVTFTLVGPAEPIGVTDYGKPLETLLRELNAPNAIRADVAAFRLKHNVDVLIVIAGANRGIPNDAGGYAIVRGNALQSTVVVTNTDLRRNKIAHEIGHLLGADHHTAQRTPDVPDLTPFYGHITPQGPEFGTKIRNADIMMDTSFSVWQCSVTGVIGCKQDKVFSDPSFAARTSLNMTNPVPIVPSGCALQSPFGGTSPCPDGSCKAPHNCPYPLAFGYCAVNTNVVHKFPVPGALPGDGCYPKSMPVNPFTATQFYGVETVSNVASLWKSPRTAEVATFRDAAKPFLYQAISTVLTPALLQLL
jgi:hypothetical protein